MLVKDYNYDDHLNDNIFSDAFRQQVRQDKDNKKNYSGLHWLIFECWSSLAYPGFILAPRKHAKVLGSQHFSSIKIWPVISNKQRFSVVIIALNIGQRNRIGNKLSQWLGKEGLQTVACEIWPSWLKGGELKGVIKVHIHPGWDAAAL